MSAIKLAIVGVGKIVHDQHLPAVAANPDFQLVASASRHNTVEGLPGFTSIEAMLAAVPEIDAVSLCMPPQYRYQAARAALLAGKHVFLEKPPGATLSEVADLEALAAARGLTLFTSWHSRYAPGVQPAKAYLAAHPPTAMQVIWKEDVRQWHPNQEWIWQAGGLGVFDPGINALSIVTEILPAPIFLNRAALEFPENRDAPIGAELQFQDGAGMPVQASFDWRQTGKQSWDIVVQTADGELKLSDGGARLWVHGVEQPLEKEAEYPSLYRRFAELVRAGRSDVDVAPLRHVADAFMLGQRKVVEAFHD
ncbi:gfo/Idh/MocA family oxidoreductase [Duganella sp. BJB488]|uniref:Gfo/Idh/MocA family protein n=1 Tax=unclassified Duganella TaxID=2636909 RepID=UPI000E3437B7|nr:MULTISPECIES: Gfo/Idh/MocA family oxidoreductase [unclassified Duganella]RFP17935.1 gfo/Idh/MocA family oxidoreductase [Duganella sp. BJB489]RFP22393.1 gfo/Idh/MocA family oxidoreductase [Duganella sp. BJB488]RFP37992.1 gfo/Idh/MocA family oxidoreductase [Duganella sp. BJB480]